MSEIIVITTNEVPGAKIVQILGVVKGNTVRARNIGRDIGAGFKSMIGGEVKTYTDMTTHAREEAFNRMVNDAVGLKADAIINIRFTTSVIMQGAAEMLAYGTAVKLAWSARADSTLLLDDVSELNWSITTAGWFP